MNLPSGKEIESGGTILIAPTLLVAGVNEVTKGNHLVGAIMIIASAGWVLLREKIKPAGK